MNALFLEPLDVLFFRGNKLFGDAGSFGESLVPPWPSAVAGALRSRMLVDAGVDPVAFARGESAHRELGMPDEPGTFTVTAFHLARRDAKGEVEALFQPPADLVITENVEGKPAVKRLLPTGLAGGPGVESSAPLPKLPVLAERERSKPASGYWLTEAGWQKYLHGKTPEPSDLVGSGKLWSFDHRVGVGLDAATRRAAEGRLFAVQAVAMTQRGQPIGKKESNRPILAEHDTGFLVIVTGATPPQTGTLRLGGDGRAAAIHPVEKLLPEPDFEAIAQARRCRLVLTTPGLFAHGWLPTGAQPANRRADGAIRFELAGVSGWIVSAAVLRFEVISGWDLAKGKTKTGWPKPSQRAAPTGSVWWLEELDATAEALRKLAAHGLWSQPCEDAARRAEGYNRFTFAAY